MGRLLDTNTFTESAVPFSCPLPGLPRRTFHSLVRGSGAETSAAALSDGATGQRIVLDPETLPALTTTGLDIVLRHETTHLATATDTADISPRWLVEGFAEYVANLNSGQPVGRVAAELRAQVRAGRVPMSLPSNDAFTSSGGRLAAVYEQSWLACRLIARRAGQDGLVRFYKAIGTALEPQAPAIAHAFARVLHEPAGAFTAQWIGYVKDQLS